MSPLGRPSQLAVLSKNAMCGNSPLCVPADGTPCISCLCLLACRGVGLTQSYGNGGSAEGARLGRCSLLLTPVPCLGLACVSPCRLPAPLVLRAREEGFGGRLSAFSVRCWGRGKGTRRPRACQVSPCETPQVKVLLEGGRMFGGTRLVPGGSQTPMGKRRRRRNWLPTSEPGRGSLPCPSGQSPSAGWGTRLRPALLESVLLLIPAGITSSWCLPASLLQESCSVICLLSRQEIFL